MGALTSSGDARQTVVPKPSPSASQRSDVSGRAEARPRLLDPSSPVADVESAEVMAANAGDHALIHQLLLAVCQGPTREEFHAAQDDPFYEPSDRLLVKVGGRIVSHLHLTKRVMKFGLAQLPISHAQWFATLPEYRSDGLSRRLLSEADLQMSEDGAVVALLATGQPDGLDRLGWIRQEPQDVIEVSSRQILAHLSASQAARRPRRALSTRMWRHVELRSLLEIYEQNTRETFGPLHRSEDYWRWLISRKGYDQIIVAIVGDDTLDFGEAAPEIAGYAITRRERVVEIMTVGNSPAVEAKLLTRVCREALERDDYTLTVNTPRGGSLARLLIEAGGGWRAGASASREVTMAKVIDPAAMIVRLYPEFHARSKAAGIARPCKLRFSIDGLPQCLLLTRRSVRFIAGDSQRPDVQCGREMFARMLLGQLDVDRAVASGEIKARTKASQKLLAALFPQLPQWCSPFDALQA